MIPFNRRVQAFINLGNLLAELSGEEKEVLFRRAENQNNWFTRASCEKAFSGLIHMLDSTRLEDWLSAYDFSKIGNSKDVGVLMAGNIPAVGFHDLMSVLLAGHGISAKLSSADSVLMNWLIEKLTEIEPAWKDFIQVSEMLKGKDAYIATGSDNSSRYFQYYFGKYPSLIRQNRTSVGILKGDESEEEILALGEDVFTYFGLGCRNVSKVFLPDENLVQGILSIWESFSGIADHHKYHNNYEYNKSIYLVNGEPHLDNGFLIMKKEEALVSPISVLYYEIYNYLGELEDKLRAQQNKIQCVVAKEETWPGAVDFGKAQMPGPKDYADGVDTMEFLLSL
ncbi:acyl-CoA reductase [Algoriphagus kandeliae]|uniref:Acyl-CoA reductase n=1 Tax=Algoriphagus kandeliae TaxID=2562278 RepID=A0A4Y9QYB3_9BACT|nr:acyl-CoA reductase [Algoriphagus kandeliae]TFV97349.1 acyl-CoA reductase [Algoriphagus kandeliae]